MPTRGPHVRDAHAAESSHEYMHTPTVRVDPPATPPLQYSRDQLLSVPPSGLDVTALSKIRQLGIGYRLPKTRTHRAGRRKHNAIRYIVNSRSDTLFTPSPTTLPNCTATTGRSDNTRHRNLIYLSLQPDIQPTNTTGFRIALFNAQSVGSSEKRAEISTFVTDTRTDLFFITGRRSQDRRARSQRLFSTFVSPSLPRWWPRCRFQRHAFH